MPNLQQLFELETYASGYALEVVLMQGERLVCYHSYLFHGAVLNYVEYSSESSMKSPHVDYVDIVQNHLLHVAHSKYPTNI
jgi:hypothetical protein